MAFLYSCFDHVLSSQWHTLATRITSHHTWLLIILSNDWSNIKSIIYWIIVMLLIKDFFCNAIWCDLNTKMENFKMWYVAKIINNYRWFLHIQNMSSYVSETTFLWIQQISHSISIHFPVWLYGKLNNQVIKCSFW